MPRLEELNPLEITGKSETKAVGAKVGVEKNSRYTIKPLTVLFFLSLPLGHLVLPDSCLPLPLGYLVLPDSSV
jgi:hypothetical protein